MKTITAEIENGVFVAKCVECGFVLATALPWKGLNDEYYGHHIHCSAMLDKNEISEAFMDFKKVVLSEAWSQDLTKELVGALGEIPLVQWDGCCKNCDINFGEMTCTIPEFAAIIINEQLRNRCSCKGGFHELVLLEHKTGKKIIINGAHARPSEGGG